MDDLISEPVDDEDIVAPGAVPWHFWAVVAVGLLWNGFPALDYTLTQLEVAGWIGNIGSARLALIQDAPAWATSAWALGGWSAFAGTVLLLMRSRFAPTAYLISLTAAAVSFSWQYSVGLIDIPALPIVILTSVSFFWWYAACLRERGVLQ